MNTVDFSARLPKAVVKRFTLWIFVISAAYAVICTPIQLWAASNVLMSSSVLLSVLDLLMSVLNFAVYWVSFAYLAYAVCRVGVKRSMGMAGIYLGAGVFRYVVAQGMAYWMLNEEFYASQVVDFVTYVLLDALMIAFCIWLAGRQNKRVAVEGGLLTALPIERLIDQRNPMTRLVVMLAAFPSAVHLVTRLIYDFSPLGGTPIGFLGWVEVIFGYASEIILAFVGYLVMLLILNAMQPIETKETK